MITRLIFILTLILLFACSSQQDKTLFESAKENIEQTNFVEALNQFEQLVQDYPESKYKPAALFEIGKLYHGGVVKNISQQQSFERAIENYNKVYTDYPDSSFAPNALFMVAFIQANELKQLDAARDTYNLFIEKYPDNEMVISAKEELENLGLSAEEILRKKIAKKDSAE